MIEKREKELMKVYTRLDCNIQIQIHINTYTMYIHAQLTFTDTYRKERKILALKYN